MKQLTVIIYDCQIFKSITSVFPTEYICVCVFLLPALHPHCPAWFALVHTTYLIFKCIEMLIKMLVVAGTLYVRKAYLASSQLEIFKKLQCYSNLRCESIAFWPQAVQSYTHTQTHTHKYCNDSLIILVSPILISDSPQWRKNWREKAWSCSSSESCTSFSNYAAKIAYVKSLFPLFLILAQ